MKTSLSGLKPKVFMMRREKQLQLFEKLKSSFSGLLTSLLWKLTGDAELFAEAFQYALLGIWQNIEKLDGEGAGAYIYRIALSANSKAWRNRVGKNGQMPEATLTGRPASEEVVDAETLNLVRKEIAKLPEQQAQAIVMRYIEQIDYKTIADKLNCAEDTARSHVSKAINTLRNNLAEMNISES
jgi:RNA polymerase sigma factor (sigma-70 family)